MAFPQKTRWLLALTGGLLLTFLLVQPVAGISRAGEADRPSFSIAGLVPAFGWNRSDYAIRCADSASTPIELSAPEGWWIKAGDDAVRTGDFTANSKLTPGKATTIGFNHSGQRVRTFHVRCLPADFPEFQIRGQFRGAPRLTLVQLSGRYAAAFDRHGAPVWWLKMPDGSPTDVNFLRDGTLVYAPVEGVDFRQYVIRSLDGRKIRSLKAGNGLGTDIHDLQQLANGNFMIGAHRNVGGIDAARFGGASNSTIDTATIQEVTPRGRVVWSWNAYPRIKLGETGRWWKTIGAWGQPYDVHHWNSVDRDGRRILLSFRHLDAVFCIDRRTGRILWKLGGTRTPKSLKVVGDPRAGYPLGGQHDARFVPGGITVFDNSTNLTRKQPRAVRYRIDSVRRRAALVSQVTDPAVGVSVGIGSARLDRNGNWTIGWGAIGQNGLIGIYPAKGSASRLRTPGGASYRANPVTSRQPTIERLRRAMNRIASR